MLTLETEQPKSYNLKTKIAGAVAATATIGVIAAVGLSQTTSTKQTTGLFNIPEDFKGHLSGGMSNGVWTIQGKFHKFETSSGDWQIDARVEFSNEIKWTQVYTVVDNVVIYSDPGTDMECASRSEMAGYGKWAGLLDGAQVLSPSQMSAEHLTKVKDTCPEGADAVALQFEGKTWTVCADSVANTRAMYAFDDDFYFSAVSRPGMTVDIALPVGAEKLNCTAFDPSVDRVEYDDILQDQIMKEVMGDGEEVEEIDRRQLRDDNSGGGHPWSPPASASDPDPFTEGFQPRAHAYWNIVGNTWIPTGYEYTTEDATPPQWGENKKNCIFIHGSGALGTHGKQLRTEHHSGYWTIGKPKNTHKPIGNIAMGIGQACTHYAVSDNDSFNRGFDDGYLSGQGGVNKKAAWGTYTWETCYQLRAYDNLHYNTVIFTHSMGALVTRKAFESKSCGWRGKYYTNQGPMDGSRAANFTGKFCRLLYVLTQSAALIAQLVWPFRRLLVAMVSNGVNYAYTGIFRPYCQMSTSPMNGLAFHSIYEGYPIFSSNAQQANGRYAKADGRYCGTNTRGYKLGIDALGLPAIHEFSGLPVAKNKTICAYWKTVVILWQTVGTVCALWVRKQLGDGMVPIHSCIGANAVGKAKITSQEVNHGDGTGRNGSSTTSNLDVYKWYRTRS